MALLIDLLPVGAQAFSSSVSGCPTLFLPLDVLSAVVRKFFQIDRGLLTPPTAVAPVFILRPCQTPKAAQDQRPLIPP